MVNPVIYSFFKPDFRRILKKLLRKCAPKLHEGKRRLIHVSLIVEKLEQGQGGQETDLWEIFRKKQTELEALGGGEVRQNRDLHIYSLTRSS